VLYLKHAFNESDEGVVAAGPTPRRWQFFSGCAYYEDRQPCDATTLVKFRQLLGEEGVEELLAGGWPVHVIGRVKAGQGVTLLDANGRDITPAVRGYQHFRETP